jgi:hypothetical protein
MHEYASYSEFLKSPEWALKKAEVKRRAKGLCERCGADATRCGATHHTTYKHGWDCDVAWLALLCCDCHEFVHNKSTYDPLSPPSFAELEQMISRLGTGKPIFDPKDE